MWPASWPHRGRMGFAHGIRPPPFGGRFSLEPPVFNRLGVSTGMGILPVPRWMSSPRKRHASVWLSAIYSVVAALLDKARMASARVL